MAFENSQAFNIESKKMVSTEQFESSCRLEVSADKPIKKVVSVYALPKIVSNEKIAENVAFSGKTSYQVIYETEEGNLVSALSDVEWNENITNIAYNTIFLNVKAQENTITGVSNTEIMISTLLNVEVFAIVSESVASVKELSDDYVKEEKTYEYERVVNTINESFNEVVEQEISNKVDELLYYTGNVKLKNVIAGIDTVTFEGEANIVVNLVENGSLISVNKVIDIKQEVAALSVVPNCLVDASLNLTGLKVTASVSEIDQKTNLIFAIEVGVNAVIYSKETMAVVEDAFSVKQETNVNSECVLKENYEGEGYYFDNINASFHADKEVYELSFVSNAKAHITDIKSEEKGVIVSGGVEVNLVALNEIKENILVAGFIPYSINVPEASLNDKFEIEVDIKSFKLRGQNDIEITAELFVVYKKYQDEYITFINNIEENEEREQSNAAIRVYIVKDGEGLFDVAKTLCVKPEDILAQNPIVQDGLVGGMRLIVYSSLNVNF